MRVVIPYEEEKSNIFPKIKRPVAYVHFWSRFINDWVRYKMIVDTGADYTILPLYRTLDLGIDPKKDCVLKKTSGVGGKTTVYFLKRNIKIKIGSFELDIPVGFIDSYLIPPLLGREKCLNVLKVTFFNFHTQIELR